MSAHISIYEVLNVRLFVRSMADIWQPRDRSRYRTPLDLLSSQLTAENLSSDFVRSSSDTGLDQAARILLVILSESI